MLLLAKREQSNNPIGGVSMGIRTDQHFGLNEWAENVVATARVGDSGERYTGMFGDEYPLRMFTFLGGGVYYERVQSDMWSSAPCFFLALQDEEGQWVPGSLWSEEEIEAA